MFNVLVSHDLIATQQHNSFAHKVADVGIKIMAILGGTFSVGTMIKKYKKQASKNDEDFKPLVEIQERLTPQIYQGIYKDDGAYFNDLEKRMKKLEALQLEEKLASLIQRHNELESFIKKIEQQLNQSTHKVEELEQAVVQIKPMNLQNSFFSPNNSALINSMTAEYHEGTEQQ
jgi:uncharacterized protein YdcH (DUF465 family)